MPPREELKLYNGILFHPPTGRAYYQAVEGGAITETPYTFERASWTGPFGVLFTWPWLNPLDFATPRTGEMIYEDCRGAVRELEREIAVRLTVTLDRRDRSVGPFTRTPETWIVVWRHQRELEQYNAGRLAASIIRHGTQRAMEYWKAEVLYALRSQPVEAR